VCHHENVTTTRVRTIVTIGLSLRPIVALSGDYRPDSFSPTVVPIVRGCYGYMYRHSEVTSTAMLVFSELLNCDSMLA